MQPQVKFHFALQGQRCNPTPCLRGWCCDPTPLLRGWRCDPRVPPAPDAAIRRPDGRARARGDARYTYHHRAAAQRVLTQYSQVLTLDTQPGYTPDASRVVLLHKSTGSASTVLRDEYSLSTRRYSLGFTGCASSVTSLLESVDAASSLATQRGVH